MLQKLFPFHRKKVTIQNGRNCERTEQLDAAGESVTFSAASDVGVVRATNQDNVFLMRPVLTHEKLVHYLVSGTQQLPVLFAVCDGMGGGMNGELASLLAARTIAEVDVRQLASKSDDQLESFFTGLYQKMGDAVFEKYGHLGVLVGCTATLLYIDEKRIYFVNAGDSPGMCCTGQGLEVKTQSDNRANQLYLMGQISEQERWTHKTKNQLTQYLGMDPEEVRMSPHMFRMDRTTEAVTCLICSDGLLDKNSFQKLEDCLRGSRIKDAARECVQSALEAGSRDNVTAIVVQVEAQGK